VDEEFREGAQRRSVQERRDEGHTEARNNNASFVLKRVSLPMPRANPPFFLLRVFPPLQHRTIIHKEKTHCNHLNKHFPAQDGRPDSLRDGRV
jgi:hypothetical protein